ncbi:MAG: hypothetical protein OXC62_17080 [Aestuariivita sp.]|nr:hypothetical protein [Aestuariivita sp.]
MLLRPFIDLHKAPDDVETQASSRATFRAHVPASQDDPTSTKKRRIVVYVEITGLNSHKKDRIVFLSAQKSEF